MRILVFSDTHGKWDNMYDIAVKEKADLILHCGDIETLTCKEDLPYFPAPSKFKREYESGNKPFEFKKYYDAGKVPIPTYFIAGNHENWLMLSKYIKGPVQLLENLYYFGNYGIVEVEGLVIAGFSKIYHPEYTYLTEIDTATGREIPYRWTKDRKRDNSPKNTSYFHIEDMYSLIELSKNYEKVDILLLHENPPGKFPEGFRRHGNSDTYGVEEIEELIKALSPKYVFCGHMHFDGERRVNNSMLVNIGENCFEKLDTNTHLS